MDQALDFLCSHRFFRGLSQRQLFSLLHHCKVLKCPTGSVVYYMNEWVGSLLLVMDGMLCLGEERAYPGNSLFLHSLGKPYQVPKPLIARMDSRIIVLDRGAFLSWLDQNPTCAKGIGMTGSRDNYGFPKAFWKEHGPSIPLRRRNRKSHSLILREWWPFWLVKQLPWLLPMGLIFWFRSYYWGLIPLGFWAMAAMIIRKINGLFIGQRAIIARVFRLRKMERFTIKIPLEQVKSVEVHRQGILKGFFSLGELRIKTSTKQGSLVIPRLRRAQRAGDQLNQWKNQPTRSWDSMTLLKEAWRKRRQTGPLPKSIFQGRFFMDQKRAKGMFRFRKSLYPLLRRILLPFLILLLPLCAWVFRFFPSYLDLSLAILCLFPLGLLLYRFEDWRNDLFKVESGMIFDVDRKPLGKEMTRRQAPIGNIENVTAHQNGFLEWLFNSGEVHIHLPGGDGEFIFEEVSNPWYVQDQILRLRQEEKENQQERAARSREKELIELADLLAQELSVSGRL